MLLFFTNIQQSLLPQDTNGKEKEITDLYLQENNVRTEQELKKNSKIDQRLWNLNSCC
jgi:hypothetical protein